MSTDPLPFSTVLNVIESPLPDARALRAALVRATTSTTLITASGPDGEVVGIVATGFNFVLGTPPLVLWSLASNAANAALFRDASHWAVHILAPCQTELHARVAGASDNPLEGVAFARGIRGVPLLEGCIARFVCRHVHAYGSVEHFALIGEIIQFQPAEMNADEYDSDDATSETPAPGADVRADSLGFLLGSAFFHMYGQLREAGGKMGFTNIELFVIMALGERAWRSRHEINALLYYGGHSTNLQVLDDLEASGILASRTGESEQPDDMEFELTPGGQVAFVRFTRVGAAIEANMERLLGSSASTVLRTLLREFIKETEDSRPVKWR